MVSLQEPKELLETTDKIAHKLVQQIQLLKRRSEKCGEDTRPRQRDSTPERNKGQRLLIIDNLVNNTYDFQCKKLSSRQSAVSTASGSNSASTAPVSSTSGHRSAPTSTSCDTPTEAATKHKLSPEDKVNI
ncbi:hypothetical protein PS6_007360 [Mucor atramentarius]